VYEATDNSIESSICVAAATGSNLRMNALIKNISSSKFMNRKYRLVANQLSCNGINVADFAALAGNTNVANKLKSYRGKNVTINDIATTYKGTVTISG
jgi:hypothetical protein